MAINSPVWKEDKWIPHNSHWPIRILERHRAAVARAPYIGGGEHSLINYFCSLQVAPRLCSQCSRWPWLCPLGDPLFFFCSLASPKKTHWKLPSLEVAQLLNSASCAQKIGSVSVELQSVPYTRSHTSSCFPDLLLFNFNSSLSCFCGRVWKSL